MAITLKKDDKGHYTVSNPTKKGAVLGYKGMHDELVQRLGITSANNQAMIDKLEENYKVLLVVKKEKLEAEQALASLRGHWTAPFLPKGTKSLLKKMASTTKS